MSLTFLSHVLQEDFQKSLFKGINTQNSATPVVKELCSLLTGNYIPPEEGGFDFRAMPVRQKQHTTEGMRNGESRN